MTIVQILAKCLNAEDETESDPATKPPRAVAYALEAAAVVRLAARVETDGAALLPPYVNVELTPILPLNKLVTVIKLGGLALRAAYINNLYVAIKANEDDDVKVA